MVAGQKPYNPTSLDRTYLSLIVKPGMGVSRSRIEWIWQPHGIRNNPPDFLRAMSVKVSMKNGQISNLMTMRKRWKRFREVDIVDETNGLELDFVK